MDKPKKAFGGRQPGAGRPPKPAGEKDIRFDLYLPPALHGLVVDAAGTGRGAVNREIRRVLAQHYATAEII